MRASAKQMRLILQRHVPNLGDPGDIVDVRPGYGRNYLIPKGLAVVATDANINMVMTRKDKLQEEAEADRRATQEIADRLEGVAINVKRKVADGDTLYGSVSTTDIVGALEEEGFEIGKDQVLLPQAIKSTGVHEVPVRLRHGIETTIKVWVVPEEGEPEAVAVDAADVPEPGEAVDDQDAGLADEDEE